MAEIISSNGDEITLQVKVKLQGSLMDMEHSILQASNEVGALATREAISKFDTTGAPIEIADIRMTSKGKVGKRYETPYGAVDLERHVYQSSRGGKTYCPLDDKARIVTSSTPSFAKMISHKYARSSAKEVAEDMEKNHGRSVSRSFLQRVADMVGSIAQATEEDWMYSIPKQDEPVKTIALSLDGTCVLMRNGGYREAMTGTISLYNNSGERLHSIYLGAAPEHGKKNFLKRFEKEIYAVKLQYPEATYIGIADGAKTNWDFLEKHTTYQILDFYHATEYLSGVSRGIYEYRFYPEKRKAWLDEACHRLKNDFDGSKNLLREMKNMPREGLSSESEKALNAAITYFTNQQQRMDYEYYCKHGFPIGSGVTEAACKTLVKQRLCQSGMKWGNEGARLVLSLRALVCTKQRFEQFWERINLNGISGLI